jgi:uncharacterized membrane protein
LGVEKGRVKMIKVETSVMINRPIEEVFVYATNPENIPIWRSHVMEVKQTSEVPVGVGTTMTQVVRFLELQFETTAEVTEYEPNRKYGGKQTSGSAQLNGVMTFEPVRDGTKVTTIAEVEPGGLLKVAEPIIARVLQRESEHNLATLKDIMEVGA